MSRGDIRVEQMEVICSDDIYLWWNRHIHKHGRTVMVGCPERRLPRNLNLWIWTGLLEVRDPNSDTDPGNSNDQTIHDRLRVETFAIHPTSFYILFWTLFVLA